MTTPPPDLSAWPGVRLGEPVAGGHRNAVWTGTCDGRPVAVRRSRRTAAWAPNLHITDDGQLGLLDWDESRVDVTWHDLSNLGIQVLDDDAHERAQRLSDVWEAANAWTAEPDYARRRLARLVTDHP